MPVTLEVKTEDAAIKTQRKAVAQRVINCFGLRLPESRLLCFLDDEDPSTLRDAHGPTNRGLYGPIHDDIDLDEWPKYVRDCIYHNDHFFGSVRIIDDLVYLYGSTRVDDVGLAMTMAHEIQHSIQHAKFRKLWAINSLVRRLDKEVIHALNLKWSDVPTELEARVVSRRVGDSLFGEQLVSEYIDRKISEQVTDDDATDWQDIRRLKTSNSVDLVRSTRLLLERLRGYWPKLQAILDIAKQNADPDFVNIDLDAFFDGLRRDPGKGDSAWRYLASCWLFWRWAQFRGAQKHPAISEPHKERPLALRIGLVQVRLGEPKSELQNESSDSDIVKITDTLWEIGTPDGNDHAGTIIFTNGYVTYADREWLLKGSNPIGAILGAIDSFQGDGLHACVISHDTVPDPSAPSERATINCGARRLIVSKVNVSPPFGSTEKSASKEFEQVTEVIGSK